MLKALLPLFRAGVGGVIGSGTQGMSWVGLDDVVGAFHQALYDDTLAGPVNVTAPEPVSNHDFTKALGRVAAPPDACCPCHAVALRLLLGRQMADETALSSAWVLPVAPGSGRLRRSAIARWTRALAHYLP